MNNLQTNLGNTYENPTNFRPSEGGHMSYHRLLFDDANGDTYFTKAHDPSFFEEEWREKEMRGFLEKESRFYKHLSKNDYRHIPVHNTYQDNVLVLNGLLKTEGWHWRAPKDNFSFRKYTEDVLDALLELESIIPPNRLPEDEVAIDVFYNHGWDKLHEIDIPNLVISGIKKWGENFHPETIEAARTMLDSIDELSVKRVNIVSGVLNHHDARQANIAWHPEKGTAIVDWSWADSGLPYGDTTMFLLDLHKSGHRIDTYMNSFNPTYAKMIIGYWLQRSQTKHTEGNQAVRIQQFLSAIKASELILKN